MDFPDFDSLEKNDKARFKLNGAAREEFDAFMLEWIKKYKMSDEAYRGISYLMSSYVMVRKNN